MNKVMFSGITDGILIDRIVRDCEFTMPTKHFHNEYELYYLLEGTRYYFIEDETYLVKKGSLVLINAFQIHKTGSIESSYHDRILIEFHDEPFASFLLSVCNISLNDLFATNFGVMDLDCEGQKYVESLLFSIINELEEKKDKFETMLMFKMSELLIYVLRYKSVGSMLSKDLTVHTAKHSKVHEVAAYIVSNLEKAESLDDLSKRFFISKSYLSRIFKEVTGFNVHEYINIHRIKRAQELLSNTQSSITEISDNLGYESITYFERVFKKYTETSPLKYRKKFQIINQKVRERKFEEGF